MINTGQTIEHDPKDTALQCLAMAAGYLGLAPSQTAVAELASRGSATVNRSLLLTAVKSLKMRVNIVQATPEQLGDMPTPAIAVLKDGNHVVVGRHFGAKILLVDPRETQPQIIIPTDAFLNAWSGEMLLYSRGFTWKALIAKYNLTWFTNVILHYKKFLGEVVMAAFFLQIFGLVVPLATQVIIDKVIGNNGMATLDVLIAALLVMALFQTGMGTLRTYLFTHTTNKMDVILGTQLFRHLAALPLPYFERRRVGDTMMRVAALGTIRNFLTGSSMTVFLDTFFSFVFLAIMLYYSVPLTLISMAAIPVFILQNVIATPIFQRRLEAQWAAGAESNAFIVEAITGIQTVKSLAVEPQFKHRWEQLLARSVRTSFDTQTFSIVTGNVGGLVQKLSGFAVLWYGGYMVMEGKLTLGQLIAFQMLAGQANGPILELVSSWQTVQQAGLSMERLGDIINTRPEPVLQPVRSQLAPLQGEIKLEQVNFRYSLDTELVLQDVSLRIVAGQRVGIVGRSGSGKSTITKLIQKLYDPESGQVLIDGHNLTAVEPQWFRRQMGVVMQENYLFNGSVRDNIATARPSAPMDDVIRAARTAGAHDFILELPEGYDTRVGERGASLSGGQRQRIAIARAMLTDPRILIFDEATSALDYESERIIMDNLDQIAAGRTMIIIAHRLSTVEHCDNIVVIDRGRIVELGTHAELLALRGQYYNLHKQQEG